MVESQKMFRVSRLKDHTLDSTIESKVIAELECSTDGIDAILISDFVYGVITPKILATIKKIAIEVNDYPGFIANRILLPMINEAIEALHTGVAKVQNIDSIMKIGMGHPMGPLQLADFIGLDVCISILEVMHEGLKDIKYAPSELLKIMVNSGKLGVKSGEGFYDYSNSKKAEIVAKQFQ